MRVSILPGTRYTRTGLITGPTSVRKNCHFRIRLAYKLISCKTGVRSNVAVRGNFYFNGIIIEANFTVKITVRMNSNRGEK